MNRTIPALALLCLAACNSDERAAQSLVASRMKDPASVQFRNVTSHVDGYVCGELNARNGYGAYAGFQHFVVTTATHQAAIDGADTAIYPTVYLVECTPAKKITAEDLALAALGDSTVDLQKRAAAVSARLKELGR